MTVPPRGLSIKLKMIMKLLYKALYAGSMTAMLAMAGCTQEAETAIDAKHTPMTFDVRHPSQHTRVTDSGFESGDQIGLFVHSTESPLETGGNLVNNEALTFNGSTWAAARTLYWDEGTFDAYAYYPYTTPISSVEDQPYSVRTNQSTQEGYEASDFLYASTQNISASNSPISLTFRHIMSKLTIRLVKGEDFVGELPTDAEVYVHNTVPTATIDLNTGVATRNVKGTRETIKAKHMSDNMYSAIIVPQRVENRVPLVEVVMEGVSYMYETKFQFKPGVEHLVNLVVSENPEQVKIEIGGEIQGWQ